MSTRPPRKTAYYTHPDSLRHEMGPGHPECPERLLAIEALMQSTGLDAQVLRTTPPKARLTQIALAHTKAYIDGVVQASQVLMEDKNHDGASYVPLDPDTLLNRHTLNAALGASGAVIAAIDAVVRGDIDNAFCATRPPGHHATQDRAMGFCVFNQIAIGAKYAVETLGLQRVAIVDVDVHHGNGTEDIVGGDERILMVGFFQHPFYPYSGTQDLAPNIRNTPVAAGTTGEAIRQIVSTHWMPKLERFKPELLLISAGFDAHRDDSLGQLGLVESDYVWITRELMKVADTYAQGRIVSSLEGGYNVKALARSVVAHVQTLLQTEPSMTASLTPSIAIASSITPQITPQKPL